MRIAANAIPRMPIKVAHGRRRSGCTRPAGRLDRAWVGASPLNGLGPLRPRPCFDPRPQYPEDINIHLHMRPILEIVAGRIEPYLDLHDSGESRRGGVEAEDVVLGDHGRPGLDRSLLGLGPRPALIRPLALLDPADLFLIDLGDRVHLGGVAKLQDRPRTDHLAGLGKDVEHAGRSSCRITV